MLERENKKEEQGFVLATSLVMLSLMTLLAIAMYFNSKSAIQISGSAQHSTEGRYYAETGANYMIWARNNDAEFDNYSAIVAKSGGFSEPTFPAVASSVGDKTELEGYYQDPGPTAISDTLSAGTSGQVKYFDNTPMAGRAVCVEYVKNTGPPPQPTGVIDPFPKCINLWQYPASRFAPALYPPISTRLPRYIVLEIYSNGVIVPSIPTLPHRATPVVNDPAAPNIDADVPKNGAIVWLTTGNSLMDFEVDASLAACNAATMPADALGCDKNPPTANPDGWLHSAPPFTANNEDQYGIVVYSIGYVNGRPSSIIRAQIR